jgi:hypothetical protein
MSDNARTRLAALREKKPPTKAAQIRNLWPEIKAALENGHSLKSVSECLAADGIAVSFRELSVYVGRLRQKSVNVINRRPVNRALVRDGIASAEVPPSMTRAAGPYEQQGARDPLANVRERQKKPSGFDYRPELADPKALI